MSYSVKTISVFEKQAKKLSKKYPSLKSELKGLITALKEQPDMGTMITENCYKIRLAIKSKGKGKSGGARVVTYVALSDLTVYLLSIYDKSDKESLSDRELIDLLNQIPN